MKKAPKFSTSLILIPFMICAIACSSIRPYSLVKIESGAEDVFVLMPPSENLKIYDSALAEQWVRTTNYCTQIRIAIAEEIEQRRTRLHRRESIMLLIGSMAGMTTAVYAGAEDNPDPKVLVPLGLISGTSLTTALPSLSKDERIDLLQDKLEKIRASELRAVEQMNMIEVALVELGILERDAQPVMTGGGTPESMDSPIVEKEKELEGLSGQMRTMLAAWATECK